jgi:hypothetical protein
MRKPARYWKTRSRVSIPTNLPAASSTWPSCLARAFGALGWCLVGARLDRLESVKLLTPGARDCRPAIRLFVGVVHFRDCPLRGAGFAAGFCFRALGPLPAGCTCFSAIHFSSSERRTRQPCQRPYRNIKRPSLITSRSAVAQLQSRYSATWWSVIPARSGS